MESARARRDRRDVLPLSLPPRGLSREEAAAYVGVSPSKFSEMVKDRTMPRPKKAGGRSIWDRLQLDAAFAALPGDEDRENQRWEPVL